MELDGNEQYWTRRAQNPLNELDRTSVEWTGLSRTALQKTEMDGTALHWTGLSQAELDFTRLHYTALPWIGLERTIQDSQFNAPRQTDLHRKQKISDSLEKKDNSYK